MDLGAVLLDQTGAPSTRPATGTGTNAQLVRGQGLAIPRPRTAAAALERPGQGRANGPLSLAQLKIKAGLVRPRWACASSLPRRLPTCCSLYVSVIVP